MAEEERVRRLRDLWAVYRAADAAFDAWQNMTAEVSADEAVRDGLHGHLVDAYRQRDAAFWAWDQAVRLPPRPDAR